MVIIMQKTLIIAFFNIIFFTSCSADSNIQPDTEISHNGNLLIFESVKGRILEISPSGEVVWEYISPVADDGVMTQGQEIPQNRFSGDLYNEFFLAYRYTSNYGGLNDIDLTSKGVIEN